MQTTRGFLVVGILVANFLSVPCTWAVSVGQIDTFEDGTTQGWMVSAGPNDGAHPAPPANVLGGPAGASDNFLLLTAVGGSGAGSRLTVLNLSQWSGNYLSAGVGSITMDLRNLGSTDLALRLSFEDPLGGPPTNIAFSKHAILLPAGGVWTTAVFPIGVSDLLSGLGDANSALMNTTVIRLYHSTDPLFPGGTPAIPPIVAQLGVDNIRAGSSVPDGGSTALLLFLATLTTFLFRPRIGKV